MNINPEFRRNLWLELSPQRLIGLPLVLGALFLLAFTLDGKRFGEDVARTALFLFGILAIVWGSKLAGESVISEIRDRTWDGQRMSVIGPWAMMWGKLFGSTAYPWYGAILCILVYAAATPLVPGENLFKTLPLLAGAGLAGQITAFFASLLSTRRNRRFSRSQAAAFSVLGIMTSFVALSSGFRSYGHIEWFGHNFLSIDFTLLSLAFFLFWTFTGAYRLMRLELQLKNPPWIWFGFILFLTAYSAGFSFKGAAGFSSAALSRGLFSAFVALAVLIYLAALVEPKDPMRFRGLILAWKNGDWKILLRGCPSWILALPLLAVMAAFLTALPPEEVSGGGRNFGLAVAAGLFLVLRDMALVLFFNFSKNRKRADMLTMLWFGLLWAVIPLTLSGLGFVHMAQLFRPAADTQPLLSLLAAPCEMLLAAWLAARRWKANYG